MIHYPTILSEFEIQSYVYTELEKAGYIVRGEVTHKGCQFDIVVYKIKSSAEGIVIHEPMVIIEIKRGGGMPRVQRSKYSKFGVPVLVYNDGSSLPVLLLKVKAYFLPYSNDTIPLLSKSRTRKR